MGVPYVYFWHNMPQDLIMAAFIRVSRVPKACCARAIRAGAVRDMKSFCAELGREAGGKKARVNP